MAVNRRHLLTAGLIAAAAVPAGYVLTRDNAPHDVEDDQAWNAGPVQHLLPAASATRFLIKLSLNEPRSAPPSLLVDDTLHEAEQNDSVGQFFIFDVKGLIPDTTYQLRLVDGGQTLTDPWSLKTFPARQTSPERVRLLAYSCAGGPDIFFDTNPDPAFLHSKIRKRLLARALSFAPDLAIANGDHVYWDINSKFGWAMGKSPTAWLEAGFLIARNRSWVATMSAF